LKPLLLLQIWTFFTSFFPFLLVLDGKYIRWMWRVPFFMETYLKKFSWNNHLVLWQIQIWCVDSRSRFMVWSMLPRLGMLRSIVSFFDLVPNYVNLITTCIYSTLMETLWLLFYMWMTYSLLIIIMTSSLYWRNSLQTHLTWHILVLCIILWVFKYYHYVIDVDITVVSEGINLYV